MRFELFLKPLTNPEWYVIILDLSIRLNQMAEKSWNNLPNTCHAKPFPILILDALILGLSDSHLDYYIGF